MATRKTVKLEYIKWVDAIGGTGSWTEIGQLIDKVVMEVYSAGYVFSENEQYVMLVPHWHPSTVTDSKGNSTQDGFGEISIPKCAILERKVLKTLHY